MAIFARYQNIDDRYARIDLYDDEVNGFFTRELPSSQEHQQWRALNDSIKLHFLRTKNVKLKHGINRKKISLSKWNEMILVLRPDTAETRK